MFEVKRLLLGEAMDNGKCLFDVFDPKEYTLRVGSRIYDFKNEDLKKKILKVYGDTVRV